jgi:hypothetical protein
LTPRAAFPATLAVTGLGLAAATFESITLIGRPCDPDRIVFSGTRRGFLAAAIRHYLADPDARAAIGTAAAPAALKKEIEAEPVGLPLPRPTARRRLRPAPRRPRRRRGELPGRGT